MSENEKNAQSAIPERPAAPMTWDADSVGKEIMKQRRIWQLTALSPMDGRYHQIAEELSGIFSEYALIKWRVHVEARWLGYQIEQLHWVNTDEATREIEALGGETKVADCLNLIASNFSPEDAMAVKDIEAVTNHDVKACELWLAEWLQAHNLGSLRSFVHLGLTSEDVNSMAYAHMLSDGRELLVSELDDLMNDLKKLALEYAHTPMLAHTHGQPASPTTFGKEMAVYALRFGRQTDCLKNIAIYGKFSGATGTNAAFRVMTQEVNSISTDFIDCDYEHGIWDADVTTQIEPHDYIARLLNDIKLAGQIIRDLDLDMWTYISMEYLGQKAVAGEVGSSTMPHKVNPITFENSEANIKALAGLCNALADELPRSRLQRDLSDSSLLRNLGLIFGYAMQAIRQTRKGLSKITVNKDKMLADLEAHPEVLAEPIQTALRKRGVADAYDRLKHLTRGHTVTLTELHQFILDQPELTDGDKKYLVGLTPANYIGNAPWQVSYAAEQLG